MKAKKKSKKQKRGKSKKKVKKPKLMGPHQCHVAHDPHDNKWKIGTVDNAQKGETVIFERDPDHDLYFQFPDGLFVEPPVAGTTEVLMSSGHGNKTDLTKIVKTKKGKKKKTFTYAIFIPDLAQYVESTSPPTIIIR